MQVEPFEPCTLILTASKRENYENFEIFWVFLVKLLTKNQKKHQNYLKTSVGWSYMDFSCTLFSTMTTPLRYLNCFGDK
jgi:hypothetical protein